MSTLTLQRAVYQACLLEVTAGKAGNVHPEASFEHIGYGDFVRSAAAVAPVLAGSETAGVGQTILNAVRSTGAVCPHNTNLGIILLLAPLAAVPAELSLREGIGSVLSSLSVEDSRLVFEAIRLAAPRGLGDSEQENVAQEPTLPLVEVMRFAAGRDLIARQFSTDFEFVLDFGLPLLKPDLFSIDWETQVIGLQLAMLAETLETDILRKCGRDEAEEASRRAQNILDAGWPDSRTARSRFSEFDAWLRASGSHRNPGTVADLVTACLFAAFRDGFLEIPDLSVSPETRAAGNSEQAERNPGPDL